MPGGGKTVAVHVATTTGVYSVSLPDGGIASFPVCGGSGALFARESTQLLVCLASDIGSHKRPVEPAGALLQLTMGAAEDGPDVAAGEPPDEAAPTTLWAGPTPARAAVVFETDSGARRVALATAGGGVVLYDAGAGCWQQVPGSEGCSVASLDFAEPTPGGRTLVAAGADASGLHMWVSRGAMAGAPAAACDWAAVDVPGPCSAPAERRPGATCLARLDAFNPAQAYVLVVPPPTTAGGALWVSTDMGNTWQGNMLLACGSASSVIPPPAGADAAVAGWRLCGVAVSGTRPGRLLVTGVAPAVLPPGTVPVPGVDPAGLSPVVLFSSNAGASWSDLSPAVAAAAAPAAQAARARHLAHAHTAACPHHYEGAAPLPLFAHAAAVVALPDGQVMFSPDPEAVSGAAFHAVAQLPGTITALSADDGVSAPSALVVPPPWVQHAVQQTAAPAGG